MSNAPYLAGSVDRRVRLAAMSDVEERIECLNLLGKRATAQGSRNGVDLVVADLGYLGLAVTGGHEGDQGEDFR